MKHQFSWALAARLAALAILIPGALALARTPADPASVAQVLDQVKIHAQQADYDAELLDSYARSGLSWESHSIRLNEIRKHVNDLFQDYSRLQNMTDAATPKHREAINRLEPMLRKMAHSLLNTIEYLNDNHRNVNLPGFRARIHSDYVIVNQVYKALCECTGDNA